MGYNIQGIAYAGIEDGALFLSIIGLPDVLKKYHSSLEHALSSFIGKDELYLTNVGKGMILTCGTDIDIRELTLYGLPLGPVLRFMHSDASDLYVFEYIEKQKSIRSVVYHQGELIEEEGNALNVETDDNFSEFIPKLIGIVTGVAFDSLDLNTPSAVYQSN